MRNITRRDIESMYGAILSLQTMEEAKLFFRDLLTQTEINECAERWKAARLLSAGVPYTQIISETGLSSTTVARVARWMKKGTGGYRLALRRTRSR
ncbi:MAG TPA: YerC/YecD family TrpR-related protein [Bacteroidota bacterium]|nr:YerC/YecD family TrpR-related protein [Bacteroidota bacterium]